MKNYKNKKQDIDYANLIKEIHEKLDKHRNIEIRHCYSHLELYDEITEGNRQADKLAC